LALAKAMGSLDLMLPFKKHLSVTSDSESSVLSSEDEVDTESEDEDGELVPLPLNLPDAHKFPLLHSMFLSNPSGCNLYDSLLNEIVSFDEGSKINFKRGNSTDGTLVIFPSF
jgi:hypothetical protein